MTEEQLIGELEELGVTVEWHPMAGTARGYFSARRQLVVVRRGMTGVQRRCVLAHELIHVQRKDDGPQPLCVERRVDEQAARLLISPAEYRMAELLHGANMYNLARELEVTDRLVRAYQGTLS